MANKKKMSLADVDIEKLMEKVGEPGYMKYFKQMRYKKAKASDLESGTLGARARGRYARTERASQSD